MPEVELARAVGENVRRIRVALPEGASLADAVDVALARGFVSREELPDLAVGVNGQLRPPHHPLADDDRVEFTAALLVDPKVARQRRVAKRRAALPRDKWSPDRR